MKLRPQQIVINFEFGYGKTPDTRRVRDFNNALYELARKTDGLTFTPDQLPKITGQRVTVKSARRLQQEITRIEQLIARHGFAGTAELMVVYPRD